VSQSLGLVKDLPLAGEALLKVVPIGLTGIAFSLLYFAMPNRRVLVRDALSGGFLAALAFEGMKHGFAAYISHFPTHTVIYGAFASVPIFLLWIYLSWIVVLGGAVAAAVMPEWRDRALRVDPAPGDHFLDALRVLRVLREAHHTGEIVSIQRLHGAVRLPMDRIESVLDAMSGARWVGRIGHGWTLTRDAQEIKLSDLYRQFVFRAGPGAGERRPADEVDRLALELAGAVDDRLGLSLEELFGRAAAESAPPGDQRTPANVLRLG
jgi:membrane protein